MNKEFKDKLREEFRKCTNRDPNPNEEINMENDYILVVRVLLAEHEDLKSRVKKLETK